MRKSINRTTVILVLAIFLTLSVGYALFSDTITIEGTATAQGNFDITVTCQVGYGEEVSSDMHIENPDEDQSGFENDSCIVSGDLVTANVELKHPGSSRIFTINIKNTGSIDAYLEVNPETEGPAIFDNDFITTELTNLSTGEVMTKSHNFIGDNTEELNFYISQFPSLSYVEFLFKLSDGRYTDGYYDWSTDELLDEPLFYTDSIGKYFLKLAPNDTLIALPLVEWSGEASTTGYSSKTKFTMPFDFIQKTRDMEVVTEDDVCMIAC